MEKIDFVLMWVDGSDKKWLEKKNKYLPKDKKINIDDNINRYRDMDLLKYWFRSVEKYAPWVNNIYFITDHQKPDWLNENNKKLKLINHEDFIDSKYLPTFNSSAIELGLHNIKDLSEQFVLFNDDMFIIDYVEPTNFFKDGLPLDRSEFEPIKTRNTSDYFKKICNDLEIINKYFNFDEQFKKNKSKYLSLTLGKRVIHQYILSRYHFFLGFLHYHTPHSFLKSTFKEVWDTKEPILYETMETKFRNNKDNVNQYLMQYWQLASGKFYPQKSNFSKYCRLSSKEINRVIENRENKLICINDAELDIDFDKEVLRVKNSFEKVLGEKSSFEK